MPIERLRIQVWKGCWDAVAHLLAIVASAPGDLSSTMSSPLTPTKLERPALRSGYIDRPRVVLVLDDYQVIRNNAVHELVHGLVQESSRNLRLVVVGGGGRMEAVRDRHDDPRQAITPLRARALPAITTTGEG